MVEEVVVLLEQENLLGVLLQVVLVQQLQFQQVQ